MTNDWYTSDRTHLLAAKQMPTWRNGDAKLASGDVHAIDEFIMGRLFEPIGIANPVGTGTSYLGKYKTTQYVPGTWEELLFLQTGMNLYPALGACTTVDNTTYYTHTITIRTGQDPVNQGRHWERENVTDAESERIDILGMAMNSYHAECSEASKVALQHNRWGVGYTKNSSTDDIAASSLTDRAFDFGDFTFPTVTYNSETLQADIIGWSFDVVNTLHFYGLSGSNYTGVKIVPITQLVTTLELFANGKNPFEINRTLLENYVADPNNVNLTVKAMRSTHDFIQWAHNDCYIQPFVISASKKPNMVERYLLFFIQLDTGALTITVDDAYDETYYEGS